MNDAQPPPAFRLVRLTHRYPDGAVALDGVTAEVPAGQTVAILGPSGSGKSTLLSVLGLLWDGKGPTGEVWFHDGRQERPLLRLGADDGAALRAAAFGFVLQSSYLLPHFSCLQNVAMPLALHGWPPDVRERWADALLGVDGVDLNADLRANRHDPPRQVSLGQRQRFGVLRALIADPTVVFADEPSSNLDPGNTAAMFNLLARWKEDGLFGEMRKRFQDDRSTPAGVRCWLEETAADRPPRTLLMVCHDVRTALTWGQRFLLLGQDHTLKADFPKAEWNRFAPTVEEVLGLPPGAAGRDAP